ncbi:MAG: hypothetical protein ACTSO2_09495 [Promethearchaeota archaeon]
MHQIPYKSLFKDESAEVRQAVASNPAAVKFDEYKSLFKDESAEIRQIVATRVKLKGDIN